jgi:hypothetical protein
MTADMFYQQRGQQAQSLLRQVAGDTRLMNPMALAENSPACPRSADGELVLPNGTPWARHLLMLAFTTKVLNEANALLKPGECGGGWVGRCLVQRTRVWGRQGCCGGRVRKLGL